MDFADIVRRRRMVRRFAKRPVAPEVIERILANAVRAPSAGFSQGWAFLVLTDDTDLKRFWPFVPNQTKNTPEMMNAPLVVVPLAHKASYLATYKRLQADQQWPAPYWFIDTGMAALMILLTAIDEGLGAFLFWIMPPSADGVDGDKVPAHLAAFRAEFGVPEEYTPVGAIAIGYRPDQLPPQDPELEALRKDTRELVHRGRWGRHADA